MASAKNWLEKSLLLGGKLVGAATKKKDEKTQKNTMKIKKRENLKLLATR